MRTFIRALLFATTALAAPVYAATITFDGLPGPDTDPFTTYVENTFAVEPTAGSLYQNVSGGNPGPSIYALGPNYTGGVPVPAAVTVTENTTGTFVFVSMDANTFSGTLELSIQGFLNGSLVLDQTANLVPNGFETIVSDDPFQVLDELVITGTPGTSESYNFDNIVVKAGAFDISPAILNVTQGTISDTLQGAINDAVSGDIIEIGSGTLVEAGIVLQLKNLTIRGQGRDQTFIDGDYSGRVITLYETSSTFEDLTIRRGNGSLSSVAGVYVGINVNPVFRRVDFREHDGAGASPHSAVGSTGSGTALFEECRFIDNFGASDASAFGGVNGIFINCLFAGNNGAASTVEGSGATSLVNCTFGRNTDEIAVYNNAAATNCIFDGSNTISVLGGGATASYCLFPGGTGTNISNVPTFLYAAGGDYRLDTFSWGIDAADYDTYVANGGGSVDLSGLSRTFDHPSFLNLGVGAVKYLDMGAFEYNSDYDGDGIPNETDTCPGFDDTVDADGDGVGDACDLCPGLDNSIDCNGNGASDCDEMNVNGLIGSYYPSNNLSGSPAVWIDAGIDFDWGVGRPSYSVGTDNFSVRWTGYVRTEAAGDYTFTTRTDDGARLWVDGQLLIDDWTDHAPQDESGVISLGAYTEYPITFEYYEATGGAVAQLRWTPPGQSDEVIPAGNLIPNQDCDGNDVPDDCEPEPVFEATSPGFGCTPTTKDWVVPDAVATLSDVALEVTGQGWIGNNGSGIDVFVNNNYVTKLFNEYIGNGGCVGPQVRFVPISAADWNYYLQTDGAITITLQNAGFGCGPGCTVLFSSTVSHIEDVDPDNDGVRTGCDKCLGDDAAGDTDADNVCDDVDACPGFDDYLDTDGDGAPDGCDNCADDANADQLDSEGPNPALSPVAAWRFEEGAGATAQDTVGANDATLSGDFWAPGRYGTGISLNGTTDSAVVPNSADFNFDTADTFTVTAWIQAPSQQADLSVTDNMIIEKWDTQGGYPFVIRIFNETHANEGRIFAARYDGSNGSGVLSQARVNDGRWHHVAFVRDAGGMLRLYIDGIEEDAVVDSTVNTTANNSDLYFGERGNVGSYYFAGSIDEVTIFSTDLSDTEIANVATIGLGDGVGDVCDICPGFDDNLDADNDGIPDGCDACPGFDDTLDADTDGIPDGCDLCPSTIPGATVDADGCPPAIPADFDNDGDVDKDDVDAFEACASGPAVLVAGGCEDKDFDNDGDGDQSDFAVVQRCISGANNPGDPACAD